MLSLAGTWLAIDTPAGLVPPFWNVAKLGSSQQEGVALAGWAVNASLGGTLGDVTPVQVALLEQQSDGTLVDATERLLGDAMTNGAGSVIAADFNGDGLDDRVFPAHNESPFIGKASTAYLSRAGGKGFDKLTLSDSVMGHDARLVTIDGRDVILATSLEGSGVPEDLAPGFWVIYRWAGDTFEVDTSLYELGGMSVLAGRFTGNSDNWLIVGNFSGGTGESDSSTRLGIPYSPTNPALNWAFKYNDGVFSIPPVLLPKPYFNDKPEYEEFESHWDPYSKTHTPRLWTTDLNQDGLPDILAGQKIWSGGAGPQKAVIQLLINHGNMVFTDETDALAPEFSKDSYLDYSMRLKDVDSSGMDTIFLSSSEAPHFNDASQQGQYILVNDGTGRLYAAMHDEFRAMRTQIGEFPIHNLPEGRVSFKSSTPQIIAYSTASGTINFVAVVQTYVPGVEPAPDVYYAFVNVPLGINLTTDFRRDLTVSTRNGSKRIRTFAGNDTIHRALTDPDCAIDGGLGTDTVVYPGKRAAWVLTRIDQTVTVRPAAGGCTDTLTNIEKAAFDDQTVDLTAL